MKKLLLLSLLGIVLSCSKKDDDSGGSPVVPPAPIPHVDPEKPIDPVPHEETAVVMGAEGQKYYTGLLHKAKEFAGLGEVHMQLADCDPSTLPKNFDLRDLGLVSPVKDQGQCGSCGYFSKISSLESAMLGQGKLLDLSEQEAVSCDRGGWGCEGSILDGFAYQINHGAGLESDFPYTSGRTGQNGSCKSIPVAAKGVSFSFIGAPDRSPTMNEIKCALTKYKTAAWITVNANRWGGAPHTEVPFTSCGSGGTNHAVSLIGYKNVNNVDYLAIKNSWGVSWGAAGYVLSKLGCSSLGEEVAFISVAPTPGPGPSPTPDPCTPPSIKLPALVFVAPSVEVMLGVKPTAGWSYEWYAGGVKIPGETQSMLYTTPAQDTVYKLVATSSCGRAESSVKVSLIVSSHPGQ